MAIQRATWKGHLKLALISCPIRLFKATGQSDKLSGHYLHRDTRNRIQMVPHDPVLGKVAYSDLVTAYEHEDQHVVLSDSELAEIKTPSDKTLLIETFVAEEDIDPIYFDQPYFLIPDGNVAVETFDVLRTAMDTRGKIATGRIVMRRRERMVAIAVRGKGFVMTTLRSAEEVRDSEAFFADLPSGDPSTELRNLAEQLIAMRSGRFDPHVFKDRYQAAMKDLIEQKARYGETVNQAIEALSIEAANDDDVKTPATVAEAFKLSVDGQRKPPARSRSKTARKKPAPTTQSLVSEKTPG
ncbi:MAG: Ku protein [Geminicoccaceae bacterium]